MLEMTMIVLPATVCCDADDGVWLSELHPMKPELESTRASTALSQETHTQMLRTAYTYNVVNDNPECLPVSTSWVLQSQVCASMWSLCDVEDQTHGLMDAKRLLELHPQPLMQSKGAPQQCQASQTISTCGGGGVKKKEVKPQKLGTIIVTMEWKDICCRKNRVH